MTINEPQDAAAGGICWLARWQRRGPVDGAAVITTAANARHPEQCQWCRWPMAELVQALEDFNIRDGDGHSLSSRFRGLPRDAQRALVDRSLYGTMTALR